MQEFDFQRAASLLDDDPDEAFKQCNARLRDHPEDAKALFLVGLIHARSERFSCALPIFERCVRLAPTAEEAWNNLGMTLQECHQSAKAREAFQRALQLNPKKSIYYANLAATHLTEGDYRNAKKWCKRALELDPDNDGAWGTYGFACLASGEWKEGWAGYEHCLGGRFRKKLNFTGEPDWKGEKVKSLVIYGEQGLGDEIMYASILEDACKQADSVTLECDKRLEGLFRRSFPQIEVHGTRRLDPKWIGDRKFDAGCAMGSLAHLFRPTWGDCPRKPYLVADPERRLMWRALFDSYKKPVIGLCWTGGRQATQSIARTIALKDFAPVIDKTDAVFVSLQYKDAQEEIDASGLSVRQFRHAVLTPDYDDTAALVAECDLVLGIHTTVHHLAGALGVPSVILVPSKPMWNYAHGDGMPWYGKQPFHRQRPNETWADCLKRVELPIQ